MITERIRFERELADVGVRHPLAMEHEAPAAPRGLPLAKHFHLRSGPNAARDAWVPAGSATLLAPDAVNPGFVDSATDTLRIDGRPGGLQARVTDLVLTSYRRYISAESVRQRRSTKADRVRIGVVDLTGAKMTTPELGGWGLTVSMAGASTPKVLVLLALHQLRFDMDQLAARSAIGTKDALLAAARKAWRSARFQQMPQPERLFEFTGSPLTARFSGATDKLLEQGFWNNSNPAMGRLINLITFPFIGSVAWQYGLRHRTRGGLWIWKGYASNTEWKNPVSMGGWQTASALSVATFFTLLQQQRLVDPPASADMTKLLGGACSWFFSGAPPSGVIGRPPRKCGVIPRVYNDGTVLARSAHGKTYCFAAAALTYAAADFDFPKLLGDLSDLVEQNNP